MQAFSLSAPYDAARRIHLVGIGGSGLSAIARLLLEGGYSVSGSDRERSLLSQELAEAGARVFIGHAAEHVNGADVVLRSSAIPDENVEVQAARQLGIPVLKRSEFLGSLMRSRLSVCVAGTHGKTTTTAMIAFLLDRLGQDPSYIIGGTAKNLGGHNAHVGSGEIFVIEADEYDRMFLGLNPQVAVITTLEHDHPDCYPTPQDYFQAFADFAQRVRHGGTLLLCADQPETLRLRAEAPADSQVFLYGSHPKAHYRAEAIHVNNLGGFDYNAVWQAGETTTVLANVKLRVPGLHNVQNSLAALAVIHRLFAGEPIQTLSPTRIQAAAQALEEFTGTGRRFDVRGSACGVTVIDDYAHHPTEIRATLAAARARYPGQRIWAVWQPHTFSRTQTLLTAFTNAFADADQVIITAIYAAREQAKDFGDFSSDQIVPRMNHHAVQAISHLDQVTQTLLEGVQAGDVVLVLSAGNADQISRALLDGLRKQEGSMPDNQSGKSAERTKTRASSQPLSEAMRQSLRAAFGEQLQENIRLAGYTTAQVGGPADALLIARSAQELEQAVQQLWQMEIPFTMLGSGSNIIISDLGVRGVVILNRARAMRIDASCQPPSVWAESGAHLGSIARQAGLQGLGGFEWAATVPGTLGGAVYGNAGAFGGDMQANLLLAEILHPKGKELWSVEQMQYSYRTSILKRQSSQAVILAAQLRLELRDPAAVQATMEQFSSKRRANQPPGASMGSMFKNPAGDYAGRLIEAAGLKGLQIGSAAISDIHANFFINRGKANATDIAALVRQAQAAVADKFGVTLECEVEFLGDWSAVSPSEPIHQKNVGAAWHHDQ